jgi:uncharacterized protein YneF (UPF0154 family)
MDEFGIFIGGFVSRSIKKNFAEKFELSKEQGRMMKENGSWG